MTYGIASARFGSRLFGSIVGAALLTYSGLHSSPAVAAGVRPLFDLSHPAGGPFPSDRFTVPDARHNTGLRVNLPPVDDHGQPLDCVAQRSACEDLAVLNELDGFNSLPRISIPFSGDIDPNTASSETIFLVSLGSTLHDHHAARKIIGISRRVWDADTKTLHVESDELLDQHSRYVLIVAEGIRDAFGDRVEAGEFARFRHDLRFDHRGRDHRREGRSAEDSRDAFGAPVDSGDFVRVSRDVDFDDHRDLD